MNQKEIAQELLKIKAVHLSPAKPFTWVSGIQSPIYCDNRQIMSFPETRKLVIKSFIDKISKMFPEVEVIAGTATAGIPHASWIADHMDLPMIYVRSSNKGHGLQNKIEGNLAKGKKVVLIEDLISTGKSSIEAAMAIKEHGAEIIGVVAIFSYGFKKADDIFEKNSIPFTTLTNIDNLVEVAISQNLISKNESEIIHTFISQH